MKHLLIALVIVTVYTTTSVHAANGKTYFPGKADLSFTGDLELPCRNISFSPENKVDEKLYCDMGWSRFSSVDSLITNEIQSPSDSMSSVSAFLANGYYDLGRSVAPEDTGPVLGLTDIEIDGGIFGYAVEEYLGYLYRVELGFDVSQNTVLTAEYRYLGYDEPDVLNPHGFVFGARFMY